MKIKPEAAQLSALRAFLDSHPDAELLGEKSGRREYVVDLYELERPVSMDLILTDEHIFADGAAYLAYDEGLDGWYISEPIEAADEILSVLRSAGALGA